ncbi:MAG: hypothetical protein ACRC3Z_07865 [Phocaeicola sp.]
MTVWRMFPTYKNVSYLSLYGPYNPSRVLYNKVNSLEESRINLTGVAAYPSVDGGEHHSIDELLD